MEARLLDGKTSRPAPVFLTCAGGRVQASSADGRILVDWPTDRVVVDALAEDEVRLSLAGDDARIIGDPAAWSALVGEGARGFRRRGRRRERILVLSLVVTGAAFAAIVFIGIPAASGPLARHTPPELEAQFGRNLELQILTAFKPCTGAPAAEATLQDLGARIASGAAMPFPVRVRAVRAPFVNAFALPGGLILVTDDLIDKARSPDELAGVLAHEIAHVELRHVMQGAWRSMGIGLVLDAVVGGGSGAGQQAVILAGGVWDLKFDREAEREADQRGVELLSRQNISANGLASFFDRMAREDKLDPRLSGVEEWLSSHPNSRARALAAHSAVVGAPALSEEDWSRLKTVCRTPEPPKTIG